MSETDLIDEIKRLAIQKVNTAIHVLAKAQDGYESVRKNHTRLRGKAISCEFKLSKEVICERGPPNHNIDEVIHHKLITGLADQDILQDVLASDKWCFICGNQCRKS